MENQSASNHLEQEREYQIKSPVSVATVFMSSTSKTLWVHLLHVNVTLLLIVHVFLQYHPLCKVKSERNFINILFKSTWQYF